MPHESLSRVNSNPTRNLIDGSEVNKMQSHQSDPPWIRGLTYLIGMTTAISSGSALVIGGMASHTSDALVMLALAAAIPLAALTFAITLSIFHRIHVRHHPIEPKEDKSPAVD